MIIIRSSFITSAALEVIKLIFAKPTCQTHSMPVQTNCDYRHPLS